MHETLYSAFSSGSGWIPGHEKAGPDINVAVHPGPFRPLMPCYHIYEVAVQAAPGTPRYNAWKPLKDAVDDRLNNGPQIDINNKAAVAKWGKMVDDLSAAARETVATITVQVNNPNIMEHDFSPHDVHILGPIPGVDAGMQELRVDGGQIIRQRTILYFGPWKSPLAEFPFRHRQRGPYIENFSVTIAAPADVADELIRKVNWTKLRAGLAP